MAAHEASHSSFFIFVLIEAYTSLCLRMNITKTLTSLSKSGQGRPLSDTEILKWANTTAQKGKPGAKQIRSFKDPSITTGLFFLDLLEALRPGIVDPSLVINVSETGDYEDRRQNGGYLFIF